MNDLSLAFLVVELVNEKLGKKMAKPGFILDYDGHKNKWRACWIQKDVPISNSGWHETIEQAVYCAACCLTQEDKP